MAKSGSNELVFWIQSYTTAQHTKFFSGLDNQHNQIQFFLSKTTVLLCKKSEFTYSYGRFWKIQNRTQEFREQNYFYIPLIPQLEKLLNMRDIYNEIKKQKKVIPGLFSSYEEGLNYKNSRFFKENPQGIQFHIYVDEVQMCCSLGYL